MLSIIIPTLNEEKYLPYLLDSIKEQDFKDYEIIVADADSEDKTSEIAKNYGCKVVAGGLPGKGRNEGAKVAQGELLLFLDADTILSSSFLDENLEDFKTRELGVASSPLYCKENKIDRVLYGIYNFWMKLSQKFLPQGGQAILIKKEIHQKIKGFDEEIKIGEDNDYIGRAAKFGKFGVLSRFVFASSRRFEQDGRFKVCLKYNILVGAHALLLGPVKSDIFKYRFGHYDKD